MDSKTDKEQISCEFEGPEPAVPELVQCTVFKRWNDLVRLLLQTQAKKS